MINKSRQEVHNKGEQQQKPESYILMYLTSDPPNILILGGS